VTPEQRRALLGDDVIDHCRQVAEDTTVWPPDLVADLTVLLRPTLDRVDDAA
jgi:hypothetical protein